MLSLLVSYLHDRKFLTQPACRTMELVLSMTLHSLATDSLQGRMLLKRFAPDQFEKPFCF